MPGNFIDIILSARLGSTCLLTHAKYFLEENRLTNLSWSTLRTVANFFATSTGFLISRGFAQTDGMTEVVASLLTIAVDDITPPSWYLDFREILSF